MKRGGRRGSANRSVGVLDAGVVLVRLDRRHPAHGKVCALLDGAADRRITLQMSVVNLAEVLQHTRRYQEATGVDPVALLHAFAVDIHRPDTEVARRVANLAVWPDVSIADRFAAATAQTLGGRLYTTDGVLSATVERARLPVTCF